MHTKFPNYGGANGVALMPDGRIIVAGTTGLRIGVARYRDGMWHLRAFGAAYTTAALVRVVELAGFELVVYSHTQYGDPRAGSWAGTPPKSAVTSCPRSLPSGSRPSRCRPGRSRARPSAGDCASWSRRPSLG